MLHMLLALNLAFDPEMGLHNNNFISWALPTASALDSPSRLAFSHSSKGYGIDDFIS